MENSEKINYTTKSREYLKQLCRERKIGPFSKLNKEKLVELLIKSDNGLTITEKGVFGKYQTDSDPIIISLKEDFEKETKNVNLKTNKGKTQKAESILKEIFRKCLRKLTDKPFEEAGSQQAIDFRNVNINGTIYFFELKKSDGSCFKFNDSVPEPDVFYVFYSSKEKKVLIIKGCNIKLLKEINDTTLEEDISKLKKYVSDLSPETLNLNIVRFLFVIVLSIAKHCVFKKVMTLSDYSELFKFTTDFGNISSRPRPNWTVTFSF